MKKIPRQYLLFFLLVIPVWLIYMFSSNGFQLYETYWPSTITMFFGAFVAGATSEGSGAVAFPVFTLILNLPSAVGRNFSFAMQSIGMTAASLTIIGLKVPVDWKAIRLTALGGIPGLFLGMFFIAPLISSQITKIIFVSLWLSFSFVLFVVNRNPNREVAEKLEHLLSKDIFLIVGFGFIGGIITSVFGDGINIFTFCLFTLYYQINEKIATPNSVIIMTIHTIIGFLSHVFLIKDFQLVTFNYWLCAIPVAIIMAPVGAYIVTFLERKVILRFLYTASFVQYFGALYILKPKISIALLSLGVLISGFLFFYWLSKKSVLQKIIA